MNVYELVYNIGTGAANVQCLGFIILGRRQEQRLPVRYFECDDGDSLHRVTFEPTHRRSTVARVQKYHSGVKLQECDPSNE